MATQPLTPLELVELGSRITKKQSEEDLEILRLVEDARLVVDSGLRASRSALSHLGLSDRRVETAVLGMEKREAFSFADTAPEAVGQRPKNPKEYPIPEPLTVADGAQKKREWKAVVVTDKFGIPRIMVLGHGPRDAVYKSWSGAAKPVLGYTTPRYWKLRDANEIDPDGPVL